MKEISRDNNEHTEISKEVTVHHLLAPNKTNRHFMPGIKNLGYISNKQYYKIRSERVYTEYLPL